MQDSEELENVEVNMDEEQKVTESKTSKVKKIGNKEKRILKKKKLQQAAQELQQGKFKSLRYVLLTYIINLELLLKYLFPRSAARHHNVAYTSLYKGMSNCLIIWIKDLTQLTLL